MFPFSLDYEAIGSVFSSSATRRDSTGGECGASNKYHGSSRPI